MDIFKYQKAAMRTCRFPNDREKALAHAKLGLLSEFGEVAGLFQKTYQGHELDKEHLAKELGDCMWMLAEYLFAHDMSMSFPDCEAVGKALREHPRGEDLAISLCEWAGIIIDDMEYPVSVEADSKVMLAEISAMAFMFGYTLEEIAQMNIDKLLKRFPNGFEVDKSLHRSEGDV